VSPGLEVDHEGQVGLVEAHPERRGGRHDLDPVGPQGVLDLQALLGLGAAAVGPRADPVGRKPGGDPLGVPDGQAVDDARPGQLRDALGEPSQPIGLAGDRQHRQPQALAVQRPPEQQRSGAKLLGDVVHDPLVGGCRAGQHRRGRIQVVQDADQPAIVRAEVMAPVGDAVGLVDHHQPDPLRQIGKDVAAELRVVQPLWGDQQQVDAACGQLRLDRPPLLHVGGVDGGGPDDDPFGFGDLIAHQRQQGRHQEGRARPTVTEQPGGQEVHGGLPPAGSLDHHCPAALDDQGPDGGELVVPQRRPGARQGSQ
jgi:hypothetical protein